MTTWRAAWSRCGVRRHGDRRPDGLLLDLALMADDSPNGLYRAVWQQLVPPHPLPWALALIAFEIAVGVAALGRGRAPLAALIASLLFVVGLIPASPPYTSWNALLALVPAYLLLRQLRDAGP